MRGGGVEVSGQRGDLVAESLQLRVQLDGRVHGGG
jgi:hypothetical protein